MSQAPQDQPAAEPPAGSRADPAYAAPSGHGEAPPLGPPKHPWTPLDIACVAVAALGTAMAGFLVFETMTTTVLPGCGSGSPCEAVLGSVWSRWLGLPVALPALAVWFVALLVALTRQRTLLVLPGLVLGGAAVWFVYVQVAHLGMLCPYCITAHALAVAMLFLSMVGVDRVPLKQLGVSMVALVMLIVGQLMFPSTLPQHRMLRHAGIEVPVHEFPMMGDPQADHVVLLLFDYTCPHCRKLHGFLSEAVIRYDGQLAVALAPAPLDADCNPYLEETEPIHERGCELASAFVAVWLADPTQAAAMDHYLAAAGPGEDWAAYRERAASLVTAEAYGRALRDERVAAFLQAGCDLNVAVGRSAGVGDRLPKLLLGTEGGDLIVGRPGEAAELYEELEAMLGLRPVESASP